jgi:hypothetical protein
MPTYLLDHVSDSYQFILVKSCDCLKSHSIICVNNGRKKWISGIREMTRHMNVQCIIFYFFYCPIKERSERKKCFSVVIKFFHFLIAVN